MKRSVKIILIMLTVLCLLIPPFFTLAYTKSVEGEASLLQEGDFDVVNEVKDFKSNLKLRSSSSLTAEEYLYSRLLEHPDEIDLVDYSIPVDSFGDLFSNVINKNPDLFFVEGRYSLNYIVSTNTVNYLTPTYNMTGDEIEAAKEVFYSGAAKALSNIDNSMSDLQKAVTLHDYICSVAHYPQDDLRDDLYYSAYGFFLNNEVVCQGYTLAYLYLLKQVGVPCVSVASDPMNHAWNYVQIDGEWYNVDCTWDDYDFDSTISIKGSVGHRHFLKSDSKFATESCSYHYSGANNDNYTADSTSFDNAFWDDVYSVIYAVGGNYYYLKPDYNNYVIELTERSETGAEDCVYSFNFDTAFTISSYVTDSNNEDHVVYHNDSLSRLAYLDSRFYVVNNNKIYSVSLSGTQYEITGISQYCFGLGCDDDLNLVYQHYDTPDTVHTLDKMTYYNNHITLQKNVNYNNYPDINYDGYVNAKDYAMIKRKSVVPDYENTRYYSSLNSAVSDANNGSTDNADLTKENADKAECSLCVTGDTSYVRLLKNITNSASVTFNTDAVLDLKGHSISFVDGEQIVINGNALITNGIISGGSVLRLIDVTQSDNTVLTLRNLTLNFSVPNSITDKSVCINTYAENNNLFNVSVNLSGQGKSDCAVFACEITNDNSENIINDYSVNADIPFAKAVTALRIRGTSDVENFNSSVVCDTGISGGLHIKNADYSSLKNISIYTSSNSSESWGLMDENDNKLYVEGLSITALTDNHDLGMAVNLNVKQEATIVSTEDSPVSVFGKSYGINLGGTGLYTINGGEYSSENHTAYIYADANINNAKIFTDKRTNNSEGFGFYVGGTGDNVSQRVINLNNVKIGLPDTSKNKYARSISATSNHNYQTPSEVNLYDCIVYEGDGGFFNYNYPSENNRSNTKFNIYGDTKFYYNNGNLVSKNSFDNGISNWKSTPNYSNALGKYTQSVGNRIVFGTGAARVNEDTGEIYEVYLNNGVDVFDYR